MDVVLAIMGYCTQNGKEGPILCIKGRDAKGEAHLAKVDSGEQVNAKIRPYFSIPEEEVDRATDKATAITDSPPGPQDEKLKMIWTKWPMEVRDMRGNFSKTYQAAVIWYKKAIIDLGLERGYVKIAKFDPFNEWTDVPQISIPTESERFYVLPRYEAFDIETNHAKVLKATGKYGELDDAADISIIDANIIDNYDKEYHSFVVTGDHKDYEIEVECRLKDEIHKLVEGVPKKERGRPPTVPKLAKKFVHERKTEPKMLFDFIEHVRSKQPDAIGGHNICGNYFLISHKGRSRRLWRNGFDIPMLVLRCKAIGVDYNRLSPVNIVEIRKVAPKKVASPGTGFDIPISLLAQVDFIKADDVLQLSTRMEEYQTVDGQIFYMGNRKLGTYGGYFFGTGKVEHRGEKVWELFERNWREGDEYCQADTELSFALFEKFGVMDRVFALSHTYGIPPEDAFYTSRLQKFLTLRYCRGRMMIPTEIYKEKD